MDKKYLAITGFRSPRELAAYLYDYAEILDTGTTREGVMWAVVEVPASRADYQSDRMASGMIGSSVHLTAYGAAVRILERA